MIQHNPVAPKPARLFSTSEHQTLYDIIDARRDVRNEFRPEPLDPAVVRRVLHAAHAAPSVGFMRRATSS
jgi:5,6-dimethylbenzimidazole synthase